MLYFVLLFVVYAISDVHRHRHSIARIGNMKALSPTDSLTYRSSRTAAFLIGARAVMDVLLPVFLAAIGVVLLGPTQR
jgi:hypothetical protein